MTYIINAVDGYHARSLANDYEKIGFRVTYEEPGHMELFNKDKFEYIFINY